MRRFSTSLAATLLCLLFLSFNTLMAEEPDQVDWDKFSKNLVKSLKSSNQGVQLSAMQLVIRYGDKVDVGSARHDVMRVFRSHKNQKVRQLALVTLYTINNKWSMGYLEMHYRFEEDPVIKKHLAAILVESNRAKKVKKSDEIFMSYVD
jgi:superfamily II DNA helicase RecQ